MANQGPRRFIKIQGPCPKYDFPIFPPSPNNPSNEGTIDELIDSEVGSVAHPDHQVEGVVKTIEEGFISFVNPLLTDPIGPTLFELPSSTLYLDQISTFHW